MFLSEVSKFKNQNTETWYFPSLHDGVRWPCSTEGLTVIKEGTNEIKDTYKIDEHREKAQCKEI